MAVALLCGRSSYWKHRGYHTIPNGEHHLVVQFALNLRSRSSVRTTSLCPSVCHTNITFSSLVTMKKRRIHRIQLCHNASKGWTDGGTVHFVVHAHLMWKPCSKFPYSPKTWSVVRNIDCYSIFRQTHGSFAAILIKNGIQRAFIEDTSVMDRRLSFKSKLPLLALCMPLSSLQSALQSSCTVRMFSATNQLLSLEWSEWKDTGNGLFFSFRPSFIFFSITLIWDRIGT